MNRYNVKLSKLNLILTLSAFTMFLIVGLWLLYDGFFISYDAADVPITRRIALKSLAGVNVVECMFGLIFTCYFTYVLGTYACYIAYKQRSFIVLEKDKLSLFMLREPTGVCWDDIDTILIIKSGKSKFLPPIRWVLPKTLNFATLVINLNEPKSLRFFPFYSRKVEMPMWGFNYSPSEVYKKLSHFKRVEVIQL